jgi:hypothetical protein
VSEEIVESDEEGLVEKVGRPNLRRGTVRWNPVIHHSTSDTNGQFTYRGVRFLEEKSTHN